VLHAERGPRSPAIRAAGAIPADGHFEGMIDMSLLPDAELQIETDKTRLDKPLSILVYIENRLVAIVSLPYFKEIGDQLRATEEAYKRRATLHHD
jgi:hypothetical protein